MISEEKSSSFPSFENLYIKDKKIVNAKIANDNIDFSNTAIPSLDRSTNQKINETRLNKEKNKYKFLKPYFWFCLFNKIKKLFFSFPLVFTIEIFLENERRQLVKKTKIIK